MKIAVIGGGIFGVTTAIELAKNHDVTIYEKNSDILNGSSGSNQFRVHRGYHYPRSPETVLGIINSEQSFSSAYSDAIVNSYDHYYCIAKKNSYTSSEQFLEFLNKFKLEYEKSTLDIIEQNKIDLCLKVKESLYDPKILKNICWAKLKKSNVKVFLNYNVSNNIYDNYEKIVVSTYSHINELIKKFPKFQSEYQFELCEKPVVKLSKSFENKSIVVMDGPFMCIDPLSNSKYHLLCNVVHEIHNMNIGIYPEIENKYMPFIDKGLIKNPKYTNFQSFIESAKEFFPDIKDAIHIGSMFTIRAVPPREEKTDARPTIVSSINEKIKIIFSGKITTCVEAAKQIERLIN